MKRSKLERGSSQLRRKTKLRQGSKSLARSPMERTTGKLARGKRLRQVGKRGAATRLTLKSIRSTVIAEQVGRCARCGLYCGDSLEIHHRKARSQHERGENPHARENLVGLCPGPDGCHARITDHRARDWRKWIDTRKQPRLLVAIVSNGAQHA